MEDLFSRVLIIAGLGCLGLLLWVASIAITYVDLSRRQQPASAQIAWLALVALLPGLGFLAYLFIRILLHLLEPAVSQAPGEVRRVTLLKPPDPEPRRMATIPAADLLHPTIAEPVHATGAGRQAEAPQRRVELVVLEGPDSGRVYPLQRLPLTIGRGSGVDIRLDGDLAVSRRHAEIYEQALVLRLRDLNSTHGTRVNDFEISDKGLDPGDRIQVGETLLLLRLREGER